MKFRSRLFGPLLVVVIFFVFVFFLYLRGSTSVDPVRQLLARTAREFQAAGDYQVFGTVVSMPEGNLRLLGLKLKKRGLLTREQIRGEIVIMAQRFLELINEDLVIRKYMIVYPFGIENIEITLFIDDPTHNLPVHPEIALAGVRRGKLFYETQVRVDGVLKTVERSTETYEEALEILKKQNEGKGSE